MEMVGEEQKLADGPKLSESNVWIKFEKESSKNINTWEMTQNSRERSVKQEVWTHFQLLQLFCVAHL